MVYLAAHVIVMSNPSKKGCGEIGTPGHCWNVKQKFCIGLLYETEIPLLGTATW